MSLDDALPAEPLQLQIAFQRFAASGDPALAVTAGERLLELREASLGDAHPDVLALCVDLAETHLDLDTFERAEALIQRALAGIEAQQGSQSPALCRPLCMLARVYRMQGRLGEGLPMLTRAMELQSSLDEPDPAAIGTVFYTLATYLDQLGRHEEAEKQAREALACRLAAHGEQSGPVAEALNLLADLRKQQGDVAGAEELYGRAFVIAEAALGADHPTTALYLGDLGRLRLDKGEAAQAEAMLARAVGMLEAKGGPETVRLAALLDGLAMAQDVQGAHARAMRTARRALAIREALLGPDHPEVAVSLAHLSSQTLASSGDDEGSVALLERAVAILGRSRPGSYALAALRASLAGLLFRRGDLDRAEPILLEVLAELEEKKGPMDPSVGRVVSLLSSVAERKEEWERAGELRKRALEIATEAFSVASPAVAHELSLMADSLARAGALDDAVECHEAALLSLERSVGEAHRDFVGELERLAKAQSEAGKKAAAFSTWLRVVGIEERAGREDKRVLERALLEAGQAALDVGELDAAETAFERLGELYADRYPEGDPHRAMLLLFHGDVAQKRGQPARAAELYAQALALAEAHFGTDAFELVKTLERLGEALIASGALDRAEEPLLRLLGLMEREVGPEHPALLPAARMLAELYLKRGEDVEKTKAALERVKLLLQRATEQLQAETAELRASAEALGDEEVEG
jgi:tetratricopeptide (TPR) repeat protein